MDYIAKHLKWQKHNSGKLADGEVWFGILDAHSQALLTHTHGEVLRECYIDPSHLNSIAQSNGRNPEDVLATEILPDAPHIKSGDFGEIFCRSTLQEWKDCPTFPLYRWRNRATKNDTVRGVDLIGYVMNSKDPDTNDVLVLCEVKTRSGSVSDTVVLEAFNGIKKDFTTRLTNSLYFYQMLLRKDGKEDEALRIARFSNPHKSPYKRRLVPCVVHERSTWQDTFLNELPDKHQLPAEVVIIVFCIDDLATWIEAVHKSAIASVSL